MIRVGVGAGHLDVNFLKYRHELSKSREFFLRLLELGTYAFDTARSYYSGRAEKILGLAIKKSENTRSTFQVDTKIGCVGSSLPIPLNHLTSNSRLVQKYHIVSQRHSQGFDNSIQPKRIKNILAKSLKDLNLAYVDTYFLHGFCGWPKYQDFVENLERVRAEGMTNSIGISLDQKLEIPISWCDKIQIPLSLLNEYPKFQGEIVVNQVFSGGNGNLQEVIQKIKEDKRITKVILGTRKLERIVLFKQLINSD